MYEVDERDRVVELTDVPQPSVGAPMPLVLADEHRVIVAYYVLEKEFWQDPGTLSTEQGSFRELSAVVRFRGCIAHMFGPPNDEAFEGHPLARRGLHPYGIFRIEDSSWIRKLERMNSVHLQHKPEKFWKRQHLLFSFHDSTFECVCESFDITGTRGSVSDVFMDIIKLFRGTQC